MYSMGNIVNNYIIPLYGDVVTRLIMVTIFQCIEMLNHYVMHQELIRYCRSTVLQKQTNKSIERDQTCGYQRWMVEGIRSGGKKVQTSNKY